MNNNVTRRSFLKATVGLPIFTGISSLTAAVVGCSNVVPGAITLNVVLHGLYLLNCAGDHIDLLTPEVGDHIYMAGNWDRDQVRSIAPRGTYELKGTDRITQYPPLDLPCSVILSRSMYKFYVHPEKSLFTVRLPIPSEVRLLRCIDMGPNTYDGQKKIFRVNSFSLCQVLRYPVADVRNLELVGIDWQARVDKIHRTANLHFWAEPPKRLSPAHAYAAYQTLSELTYPLHLTLGTDITAPVDRSTGVPGLPPEQEQGWSEWVSGGEGSYPSNCNTGFATG